MSEKVQKKKQFGIVIASAEILDYVQSTHN
jgi:hypothetical protein